MSAKERMLEALDEVRKRVETGETVGLIIGSVRKDDHFMSRTVGEPPGPHGILVLESILLESKLFFLERNNLPDDGAPLLGAVDSPKDKS